MTRRAKIVCTLGPATATPERVRALVAAGMDVARLNLSHGSRADHEAAYHMVRAAGDEAGRAVAVLADLQGPKIRLGRVEGTVSLVTGARVTLTAADVVGDSERLPTTYADLPADVAVGDRVLVDDGRVSLDVVGVQGDDVEVLVVEGGPVSSGKGINLPGVAVSAPALTPKDVADLRWALKLGVDLVALSFVRSPEDVAPVRAVMAEVGRSAPVIAKLEKPQAVQRLEAVVEAFDGLMVARGDLGVELPLEQVPLVQKRAIALARAAAKPVVVATQMLESMVTASRPTRAEASDVAGAVLDGADALMLSGETAVGHNPPGVVATMSRIITAAEDGALDELPPLRGEPLEVGGAIARAATVVGRTVGAVALVPFTETGDTARRLARHRQPIPVLAFTPLAATRSRLALSWGVETFLVDAVRHTDDMVRQVDAALLAIGRCRPGDLVVVVAGSPPSTPGSTNAMRVHRVGSED